jgi:LysR family pca operon transcriptional activator
MRHVRSFLALCEHHTVTNAAEALNTVQPALSRTLRELETQLGATLFQRTGKGLVLTPAGETLRQHLSAGMAQIEQGVLQASGLGKAARVAVGMLPNVTRTLVPAAVRRFKETSPEVTVRLYWAGVPELVALLRKGEIDFLASRLLSLDSLAGLSFEHLYSEPLVFVVRAGHPLAGRDGVSLADVDRHPVILPLPGTIIRAEFDRFLVARGFAEFANRIETVSFEFTRFYLRENDAVACVPLGSVRRELAEGQLVRLDLSGDELLGSVGLSFLSGRELSPAARQLAQCMREAAAELAEP